jgi:hypothetical protein
LGNNFLIKFIKKEANDKNKIIFKPHFAFKSGFFASIPNCPVPASDTKVSETTQYLFFSYITEIYGDKNKGLALGFVNVVRVA